MSMQLLLSPASAPGDALGELFRWCWLGVDGQPGATASGDRDALRAALGDGQTRSAWLILPGSRVVTRELEYSDKEKKHLRSLLPYQLEDAVIGDVDELHFALSEPADGRVTLAYTDKAWLQSLFAELASLGLEVTRCLAAPLLLPLEDPAASDSGAPDQAIAEHWTLAWQQGQLLLRTHPTQGMALGQGQAALALQLLLQNRQADTLPALHLRAPSDAELAQLYAMLPAALQGQVASQQLLEDWQGDYSGKTLDLCQGEFSPRLPVARWWKLWQPVAIFAGVCLLAYLASALLEIHRLGKDNLALRQQIEAAARQVIPQGRMVDPEKQVAGVLRQLEPSQTSGARVMELLALALPQLAAQPSVQIKGIAYAAESGELNINVQADSFGTLESLSSKIKAQGLNAELLSVNAQGNVQTARIKVTKNQ